MKKESIKPYRKAWRMVGLIFPLLYLSTSRGVVLIFSAIVLSIFLILEGVRFKSSTVNDFLFRKASMILKEKERHRITSSTWFVLASFFVALLFERDVVITAWLFTTFGDMAAEVVGIK